MTLLRRHSIRQAGGGAFDPNSLNPDFFSDTLLNYDGATAEDTGITNEPFDNNYFVLYDKIQVDDGQISGSNQLMYGVRHPDGTKRVTFLIRPGGEFRVIINGYDTSISIFSNGFNDYQVLKCIGELSGITWGVEIYLDNILKDTLSFGVGAFTTDNSQNIYRGAENNNGSLNYFPGGASKAGFIWTSNDAQLSAENISNLDTYFNDL